jgi:hypothetical protein
MLKLGASRFSIGLKTAGNLSDRQKFLNLLGALDCLQAGGQRLCETILDKSMGYPTVCQCAGFASVSEARSI